MTAKSLKLAFKVAFKSYVSRKFHFVNYIGAFTGAKRRGVNPFGALLKAVLANKVVPVEVRKMYYFFDGLRSKGRNSQIDNMVADATKEIIRENGISERDAEKVRKEMLIKLRGVDWKEVGRDFKQILHKVLTNPQMSIAEKTKLLEKFGDSLTPQELNNFKKEYLEYMEFSVGSTSGNFNQRLHRYYFNSKNLLLWIRG
jgi:hypothetical protein